MAKDVTDEPRVGSEATEPPNLDYATPELNKSIGPSVQRFVETIFVIPLQVFSPVFGISIASQLLSQLPRNGYGGHVLTPFWVFFALTVLIPIGCPLVLSFAALQSKRRRLIATCFGVLAALLVAAISRDQIFDRWQWNDVM